MTRGIGSHVYNSQNNWDAQILRHHSQRLPEREQWAFDILADGGNVKDVMDEMHVGPREALALMHQVRTKLCDYAIIPESKWNEIISAALSLHS